MSVSVVATDIVGIGAVLTALITIWFVGRGFHRVAGRIHDFLDDWNGERSRPGVPARAGVMQRLDNIEHELHPNGSTSMRDAVDRIEHQVAANTIVLQAATGQPSVHVNVTPAEHATVEPDQS
jgi:hypothetical protein